MKRLRSTNQTPNRSVEKLPQRASRFLGFLSTHEQDTEQFYVEMA